MIDFVCFIATFLTIFLLIIIITYKYQTLFKNFRLYLSKWNDYTEKKFTLKNHLRQMAEIQVYLKIKNGSGWILTFDQRKIYPILTL